MDGSRRRFLSLLLGLAGGAAACAAPVPPPKKRPAPKRRVYELDFAKLPANREYSIEMHLDAAPEHGYGITTGVDAGTTPLRLRERTLAVFKDAGWRVKKSGATALIVEGIDHGGRFHPVTVVAAWATKLPANQQPVVRRIGLKWRARSPSK